MQEYVYAVVEDVWDSSMSSYSSTLDIYNDRKDAQEVVDRLNETEGYEHTYCGRTYKVEDYKLK